MATAIESLRAAGGQFAESSPIGSFYDRAAIRDAANSNQIPMQESLRNACLAPGSPLHSYLQALSVQADSCVIGGLPLAEIYRSSAAAQVQDGSPLGNYLRGLNPLCVG